MKLILSLTCLAMLLSVTGCVVPVRERTYVRYDEHPHYYHHWEHRGFYPHHYGYYYEP